MSPPDTSLQFRSRLEETPLPEILFTIDRFQVPGVIQATRGEVSKTVYIKGGSVVHAASTDQDDTLGAFLLRSGALSPEEYRTTMRERRNSSKRYGVLLIELGLMSPAEVYTAIREQIEAVVWSLFAWQDGEVSFQIGEFPGTGTVRIQLPMRQVILRGIKQAPDAKPMVARLGPKETVFEPNFHLESLIDSGLERQDFDLLQLVDGERSLYEVCKAGPYAVANNAKLMYAFHVMQLIRKAGGGEGGNANGGNRGDGRPGERSDPKGGGAIKIRLETPGGRYESQPGAAGSG